MTVSLISKHLRQSVFRCLVLRCFCRRCGDFDDDDTFAGWGPLVLQPVSELDRRSLSPNHGRPHAHCRAAFLAQHKATFLPGTNTGEWDHSVQTPDTLNAHNGSNAFGFWSESANKGQYCILRLTELCKIMPSKMEVASQHCDTVPNKTKDILDTKKKEKAGVQCKKNYTASQIFLCQFLLREVFKCNLKTSLRRIWHEIFFERVFIFCDTA